VTFRAKLGGSSIPSPDRLNSNISTTRSRPSALQLLSFLRHPHFLSRRGTCDQQSAIVSRVFSNMSFLPRARLLRGIIFRRVHHHSQHPASTSKRWNSTFESKPYKPSSPKSSSKASSSPAWTPLTALAFGGGLGLAWVTGRAYQKTQQLNIDYAREDKFRPPRYGSVKDMMKVSPYS